MGRVVQLAPPGSDQRPNRGTNSSQACSNNSEEDGSHESGEWRPQPAIESCVGVSCILDQKGEGEAEQKPSIPDNEPTTESLHGIPSRVPEDQRGYEQSQEGRIEWRILAASSTTTIAKRKVPATRTSN